MVLKNQSFWLPDCPRSLTATTHYGSGGRGTYVIGTLFSEWGEVMVTLRTLPETTWRGGQPYNSAAKVSEDYKQNQAYASERQLEHTVRQTVSPVGKQEGYRMLWTDAERFKNTLRERYARAESTEEAYVRINVAGGPGLIPSQWVFMTKAIYAYIGPSLLYFFTASVLSPNVHDEKVSFLDNSCQYNDTRVKLASKTKMLSEIYASLLTALTFAPEGAGDKMPLRGELMYEPPPNESDLSYILGGPGKWFLSSGLWLPPDPVTGSAATAASLHELEAWQRPEILTCARLAMVASIILSAIVGGLVLSAYAYFLGQILADGREKLHTQRITCERRLGGLLMSRRSKSWQDLRAAAAVGVAKMNGEPKHKDDISAQGRTWWQWLLHGSSADPFIEPFEVLTTAARKISDAFIRFTRSLDLTLA